MAAPAPASARTPNGEMLECGHPIKIAFSVAPGDDIAFEEISVTPPGYDGGDPIDAHTQYSVLWRKKKSRTLIEMTPIEATVAYDPAIFGVWTSPAGPGTELQALINVELTITILFPPSNDGGLIDTLAFFGYLRSFTPGEVTEDGRPTATISIQPTNREPTTGDEEGPVWTTGS